MNQFFKVAGASLLVFLSACASSPEPLEISETEVVEATVNAVDVASRTLVVTGPAGNTAVFKVGPEVRNLPQVKVGDKLRVSFYSGYLIAMAEPGEAGAETEVAAGRAAEGDRPGAVVGAQTRQTVEILSVADDGTAVSFRDAEGIMQSIDVRREEGQEFARKLRPGDLVDISYSEALAVSIEPSE